MSLEWLVSIIHPDGSSLHHPDVDAAAVHNYAADHAKKGDRVEYFRVAQRWSGIEWVLAG